MKILVCGGRDFAKIPYHPPVNYGPAATSPNFNKLYEEKKREYQFVHTEIQRYVESFGEKFTTEGYPNDNYLYKDLLIINGAADGVDKASTDWAIINFVPFKEYKADWKTHGKAAGPIRNQQMLDTEKPDVVIAFPGGKGTRDMINRANKANIRVIEVKYDNECND